MHVHVPQPGYQKLAASVDDCGVGRYDRARNRVDRDDPSATDHDRHVRTTAVARSVDDRDVGDRERSALRQRRDANADRQHRAEKNEAVIHACR
jgi:hypothetical protein